MSGRCVKTLETRSWPAPKGLVGGMLIIHAAKREPTDDVGAWKADTWGHGEWYLHRGVEPLTSLPLGAVVGSARLAGCVPIGHEHPHKKPGGRYCDPTTYGDLLLRGGGVDVEDRDVSDQLPYGDFTSGRWAWLLEDAAATTERCPACGGGGLVEGTVPPGMSVGMVSCPECNDTGKCDPIPARGGQRIWRWNGLPALTLHQPYAQLCVTEATSV